MLSLKTKMLINQVYCHRCQKVCSGQATKAPGASLHHLTADQIVCCDCRDGHQSYMENQFWKGAAASGPSKCSKCQDGLTSQNSRPAYREANKDGSWHVVMLCTSCHAKYQECCKAAMTTEE